MKILGLETLYKKRKNAKTGEIVCTHSAVDFARVVQPVRALNGYKGIETTVMDDYPMEAKDMPTLQKQWEEIVRNYDIIYSSYLDHSLLYVTIKMACDKYGVKFVLDCDDLITGVSKNHPHYENYKVEYDPMGKPRYSDALYKRIQIMRNVDAITTTNQFLRYRIKDFTARPLDEIKVFPNYIDLSLYDYKNIPARDNDGLVNISYHGGASHYDDIMQEPFIQALKTVMKKHDNVRFTTNGFFFPQLKDLFGYKYNFRLGYADVYSFAKKLWPESLAAADIVVAPLEYTAYSRSKSYIKFLEYGAGKKSGVYQKLDPYREIVQEGENGYMASNYQDWVDKLLLLIENPEERVRIGNNAYETVKKHQIKDSLEEYRGYFRSLISS